MASAYDFEALDIRGKVMPLKQFEGKVLLVVNTASACGFTPQLAGLEALHQHHAGKGLVVLGFPCNQFGGQDPGKNEEIAEFCSVTYQVSFAMMGKVEVNGIGAHPLFGWLTSQAPGLLGTRSIKWNFTKFLIARDGRTVRRYAPNRTPASLGTHIEAALAVQTPPPHSR